ncbi:MAG: nucleoid-associated protein [Bacteroidales bacterium]|nr:nucleoid-associated protein [Bacteroidales bacterium]
MILFSETIIDQLVVHKVGSKYSEENIRFSKDLLNINDEIKELLTKYFLTPFKSNEFFNFYHESDLNLNEVYHYAQKVFDDPEQIMDQSMNLAKHLYENSTHPNINGGEFYTVYFQDLEFNNEPVDAIGLFKSETKETFLKVYPNEDNYSIESEQGIDIKKLDKGCLILNTEKENGYVVTSVDKLSKGEDARYWIDDFLKIKQREDEYYHTENVMKMYKDFVIKELPNEYDMAKADQVDLINKSKKFFKETDNFEMEDFAEKVIEDKDIIGSFNDYKKVYESDNEVQISDEFQISDSAVKKQARIFKSVIKLDKNFHIYVHGNREYISRGVDEKTGMQYYQIFFKEEK